MVKTYDEAISFLREYIPFTLYNTDAYKKTETHDPLDRMRVFLDLLDNPEKKFKSILIGGTSGKGSTSYLISHILTEGGYKTGLTLSPHLVRINERIQLNEKEISDEEFVELLNTILPAVEKMKEMEIGSPSYFEITIGMAFLYFAQKKVDIAVVEVGMGGMYDATNTLEPLVAVLTNVSLDHTQFLGDTVEEIAKTKVGIIKKYESRIKNQELKPIIITGVTQPSVIAIVEKRCQEMGAKLFRLRKDFPLMSLRGEKRRSNLFETQDKSLRSPQLFHSLAMTNIDLGLVADYQKENASLAIEAVRQLHHFGFFVQEKVAQKALITARFNGRFEVIPYTLGPRTYALILDGAHNQAKMHAFITSLQKAYPKKKKLFVVAFKKDKHIEEMVQEIEKAADTIILTEFSIGTDTMISNASFTLDELARFFTRKDLHLEKDAQEAVEKAVEKSDSETIIAITGSLYLVGELKQTMFREGQ